MKTENQMLKHEKSANRIEHQNRKTEVFWHKNRKTDQKNIQNRKTENSSASLPKESVIIRNCCKEIKGHLRSLNTFDSDLKSEGKLILACALTFIYIYIFMS